MEGRVAPKGRAFREGLEAHRLEGGGHRPDRDLTPRLGQRKGKRKLNKLPKEGLRLDRKCSVVSPLLSFRYPLFFFNLRTRH